MPHFKRTVQVAQKEHKCFAVCSVNILKGEFYITDSLLSGDFRADQTRTLMKVAWHLECAPRTRDAALAILTDAEKNHVKHPLEPEQSTPMPERPAVKSALWYELPIRVRPPHLMGGTSWQVSNGEEGGNLLPPRHYWPDHETQQREIAPLHKQAALLQSVRELRARLERERPNPPHGT